MANKVQGRQGDICILNQVDAVPADAVLVKPVGGRYVIAVGESSGHAHVIDASPSVEIYERAGVMYCRVLEGSTELKDTRGAGGHAAYTIDVGVTPISPRQRVWDSANASRQVAD